MRSCRPVTAREAGRYDRAMTPLRRLLETVHLTATGLWAGSLAMAGASAAIIFPAVKKLSPTLPGYAGYEGEHWKLAAGKVASRVFLVTDAVSLACMIVTGLTLGAVVAGRDAWRRPIATSARLIALFGALGLLTYSFFFLGPRMNGNMRRYWEEAEAGNTQSAQAFQAAFDADHPTASMVMTATFVCVLALLVSGAVAAVGEAKDACENAHTRPKAGGRLEEPALGRKGRAG